MLPWVFNISPTPTVVRNTAAELLLFNKLEGMQEDPIFGDLASFAKINAQTEFAQVANFNQVWYDISLSDYSDLVSMWEKQLLATDKLHFYYKNLSIPDQVFIECCNGFLGQTRNVAHNIIVNKLYSFIDPFGIHCTPQNILLKLDFLINEISQNGGNSSLVLEYFNTLFFPGVLFF